MFDRRLSPGQSPYGDRQRGPFIREEFRAISVREPRFLALILLRLAAATAADDPAHALAMSDEPRTPKAGPPSPAAA
jgi:hypothetical protein